jgi:hypothetical protein
MEMKNLPEKEQKVERTATRGGIVCRGRVESSSKSIQTD